MSITTEDRKDGEGERMEMRQAQCVCGISDDRDTAPAKIREQHKRAAGSVRSQALRACACRMCACRVRMGVTAVCWCCVCAGVACVLRVRRVLPGAGSRGLRGSAANRSG
jgi:hypothetical protein